MKDYLTITSEDNMDLMARYEDNHFDLAIVDPPYGIGESSNDNSSRSKLGKSKDYGSKKWDDFAPNKQYFKELKRVSKNQIIWGANHFIENIPKSNSSCWIVWDKQNGDNDFADCELSYCSFKTAVRKISLRWHGMLQHDMKNKELRIHPTQKPIKLYEWLLINYSKQGDKILDTHLGSGSIAIAVDKVNKSEKMNLTLTACELDKDYFKQSIERIEENTKQDVLF
jgi:site-specific DNA-methyltransferase (adenine-specific)|tara:strand:- start:165 stop:842 length:678 start_codon:yes stop_codon:yes gene_type:complete